MKKIVVIGYEQSARHICPALGIRSACIALSLSAG
jgi:hypothetical protein